MRVKQKMAQNNPKYEKLHHQQLVFNKTSNNHDGTQV